MQRSLSKEEDLKTKYERDLQSCKSEIAKLKDNLERVVAERNLVVEERNKILQERNELATQHQEEYERAERSDTGQIISTNLQCSVAFV